MKQSIKKIFTNLSRFLLITGLFFAFIFVVLIECHVSFEKNDILKEKKQLISSIIHLGKTDMDLTLIQFNGKVKKLLYKDDRLHTLYQHDITGNYILKNKEEYISDLDKLNKMEKTFASQASLYYESNKNEAFLKSKMKKSAYALYRHIDNIMLKDIDYTKAKLLLFEKIVAVLSVLVLIFVFWYRTRLNKIYKDILYLYAIETNKQDYKIFSEEVDAISLKMKKKATQTNDEAPTNMTDPLTEINNVDGMVYSYNEKKNMKKNNSISVSVIEIDNFSKTNRPFPKEFTQAVLKKIAFTLTLNQQFTDVVARTGYNQFTIILSRASREELFRDTDMIRQAISEIRFVTPQREEVTITVSGGFIMKTNKMSLKDAIQRSEENMRYAQKMGGNKIARTAEDDN